MTRTAAMLSAFGAVGLGLAAFGWMRDAANFYSAWLSAVTVLAAWPLGSIALLLVHATTGGAWGDVLRPALRMGVLALPLLFLALLPLIPGLSVIYPWARIGAASHLPNGFYLNTPFLAARVAIYCVAWAALGLVGLRATLSATLAPAGLFVLAVTVSFAAIDSTMSLDSHFVSSIYGMLTGAGMVLMALSIAVLTSARAAPPEHRADLGKLLLALVVLWIYLDFMQLLIVWQSDLAHDAPWYDQRAHGMWGVVRAAIAAGHFALPFVLLISPRMQREPLVLAIVAGLLVAMEILHAWWTVLPAAGRFISWIDVACMAGLLGMAMGTTAFAARRSVWRTVRHG